MVSNETLNECPCSIGIDISNSEGYTGNWGTPFSCVQVHKCMIIYLISNMVLLRINVVSGFHVIALHL